MPVQDPTRVYDGNKVWDGGVESSLPSTLLQPNQCAWAVNRTMRGGYNSPRPGWKRLQVGYPQALFQGFGTYISDSGQVFATVSIGGRIQLTELGIPSYPITEITGGALGNNSPTQPHTWFCQGNRNLVIQNDLELPIFYNGVVARRSNGNTTTLATHELPPGGPTGYWGGRFWFTQGSNFGAGNLVNSDLSLSDPRDASLQCTDNDFLNEGGLFSTPTSQGSITAVTSSQNVDTANGEGSLLIGTEDGVFAFNAPIDRTTWKNLQQPIQQYALIGFGPMSQESFDTVNADMYFRSSDSEVRSFFFARRDFETQWGNIPLSRQITRAIEGEAETWLYGCSGVTWNNRYLFTLQPQRNQTTGIYYLGLGVLDFFNVGGIGAKNPPAWDGIWTGLQFFGVFSATVNHKKRLFGWVRNPSSNTIELWECDPATRQDYNGSAYVDYPWAFETRSYSFPSQDASALDLKSLENANLWVDQVFGTVDILGYYKPSLSPKWIPWASVEKRVAKGDCNPTTCFPPTFNNPLPFDRVAFQNPDPAAGPTGDTLASWGYNFEMRVTGVGQVRFKELRVAALAKPESVPGDLSGSVCLTAPTIVCNTGCPSVTVCAVNDFL